MALSMPVLTDRHPWLGYVLPFAVFIVFLGLQSALPLSARGSATLWILVVAAAVLLVSRPVLSFRLERPVATIGLGVAMAVLWVLPDHLFPGYRSGWLFENALTGTVESGVPVAARADWLFLGLRLVRAALVVPIVEELFWRGWLPRWIDQPADFRQAPLGQFSRFAFWATAVLFAVEHGAYWDVGLMAGVIYNWWMIKTRSLGDLIWCHAVTNGCLSVYVVGLGKWQYW